MEYKNSIKKELPSSFAENTCNNVEILEEFIRSKLIAAANKAIPIYKNANISNKNQKQLPEDILVLIRARKRARKIVEENISSFSFFNKNKMYLKQVIISF